MKKLVLLLISHAVLLVLASTNFSAVSWLWGDLSWTWNFFQYRYRNGWGHAYVSEYALGQVLCYIAAYGLGVAAFVNARIRHGSRLSGLATVICLLGAASFCIEATHWLWSHHLSLIASFPVVMVVLWICVGVQAGKLRHRGAQLLHPAAA
jgi:hypothetical protein